MLHMHPQIYYDQYFEIDTSQGIQIIPASVVSTDPENVTLEDLRDFYEGEPYTEEFELKEGWLARMSAPGYMDCTEWTAHESFLDADNYLEEMYGDGDVD